MTNATKKDTRTPAQKAAEAALAALYARPAKTIAKGVGLLAKAEGSTWDGFKAACEVGLDAGQSDETAFKGLNMACKAEDVPKGTWNRYSPIARKLYKAIVAGELSREVAFAMTVRDAEKAFPRKAREVANTATPEAQAEGQQAQADAVTLAESVMLEGDSERARLLAQINDLVSVMPDDDLVALLDVLESWGAPVEQREAA